MQPMTDSQHEKVLDAIRALDEKFSNALSSGLTTLNKGLLALSDSHNQALLTQERRNSTFVSQTQNEQLTRLMAGFSEGAVRREERLANLASDHAELATRIATIEQSAASRTQLILGWLVTALLSITGILLAYLLARGGHP